jgi:hypothetical protein
LVPQRAKKKACYGKPDMLGGIWYARLGKKIRVINTHHQTQASDRSEQEFKHRAVNAAWLHWLALPMIELWAWKFVVIAFTQRDCFVFNHRINLDYLGVF